MRNLLVAFLLLFASSAALAADISPMTINGATTVTTEEAHKLFKDGALFVDVRRDSDWDAGRVAGAVHLNLKKNFSADSLGAEIGKGEKVVIYCNGEKCLRFIREGVALRAAAPELSEEALRRFAGKYGPMIEIRFEDGALNASIIGQDATYQLIPLTEDTFDLDGLGSYRLRFHSAEGGEVVKVVAHHVSGREIEAAR